MCKHFVHTLQGFHTQFHTQISLFCQSNIFIETSDEHIFLSENKLKDIVTFEQS